MGRDRKPKHKLSRREGKELFGTGGTSLGRRLNQPPGMQGKKPTGRTSVYAEQLREKQKVKRMYGPREEQFRRLVNMALQSREQTGLALLKLLERRLDNVIYRLDLARTRLQARQFVTHGHIRVNGEEVNIPSYLVKPGEEITMEKSALQIPDVQELEETSPPVPGWLEKRIVEFYSR
jgi:small subunit ribosomal protein S4